MMPPCGNIITLIVDTLDKLRSCYNRCIKLFFGFKRRDSLTNILLNVGLPSFDTILHNAAASFMHVCNSCTSHIVVHLRNF